MNRPIGKLVLCLFFCLCGCSPTHARQVEVHDPVMTREGNTYYIFSTGPGITIYESTDLEHWTCVGRVFEGEPAWADQGIVLQSVPNRDHWNAIDPAAVEDEDGSPWMSFGSFWEGIKLFRLDSSLVRVAEPQEWYSLAKRPRNPARVSRSAWPSLTHPRDRSGMPGVRR